MAPRDLPTYHAVLPQLQDHPLFGRGTTVGIMAAGKPVAPAEVPGEEAGLRATLKQSGLKHEETQGHYFGPEHSFIIHGPSRQQMYDLGKAMGQESVVFSSNGQHELLYTNGPHDGTFHPGLPAYGFHPTEAPPDYWTHLPGRGYVRLYFDTTKNHQAAVMPRGPAGAPQPPQQVALQKSVVGGSWAGAYPKHEVHTAHNHKGNVGGIVVDPRHFDALRKDIKDLAATHPHTAAHGVPPKPDFGGGTALKTNDQAGIAGTSKAYGKFAAPYGSVDKTSPSTLKFYPLEGKHDAATAQVKAHGYQTYYAGGKHGKPDLASKNYNTGHLMVYDPEAGSGGDFGETTYTDAWRKTHELAHALTYGALNQKYGEGRRMGALGKHRTLREAKRAVEWEWMAAHKQRDLASQLGVNIPDEDFHRELNTVMHDAVHRAVTGKFTDPQHEGFRPHPHKVPLETAMGLLDESAGALGLKDEHDLLKKSNQVFVSTSNGNLMGDKEMASDNDLATSDDLIVGLAKGLQKSIANYEEWLKDSTRREAAGKRKLEKNDACGVGDQMPGPDISKDEFGDFEDAPGGCPGCGGDKISHVGEHAGRTHFICHGCAMSYSTPRQENAAAAANGPGPDPMAKEEMVPQAGHPNSKPDPKSVLPDDKKEKEVFGSELDAGSGGPVKKGKKLAKAVAPQAAAPTLTAIIRPKTPKLPGLTPPKGAPPTLTGIIARHAVKAPQGSATFVKKPSAPAAQPQASAPISGQEKRAAGIGLIGNFLSRWKGTGEKGWVDARGAGPATPARAAATAATRMALAEKKDIKKEALAPNDPKRKTGLPSMAGATSIAHDPTKPHAPAKPVAKCGDVSTGKDVAKAAGTGIPAAPKAPKPAAAASTAAKPVTGPAKPKAPPGSAPAQKKEKSAHVLPDGSGFMTGTVGASKKSKG